MSRQKETGDLEKEAEKDQGGEWENKKGNLAWEREKSSQEGKIGLKY